jgi:hypothetical protein
MSNTITDALDIFAFNANSALEILSSNVEKNQATKRTQATCNFIHG